LTKHTGKESDTKQAFFPNINVGHISLSV